MARITIPSQIFPGFKTLSELNEGQLESLTKYISILPLDIEYAEVANRINEILQITTGKQILQTFLSFRNLSEENDLKNEKLATNLTDSYLELSSDQMSPKKKLLLKTNLQSILNNYSGIKAIISAREVLSANGNNIEEFSLNSDIRLIFNEADDNKKRSAIIFHRMQIEYSKNDSLKDICFSLDIDDLKKIKIEIEKAIKNDRIIRDDYKDILEFIF
ncbi:hypothetical protein [Flavobacterium pectinovorum]|uniref:Uncharacterized protein n=1 Tax=Flavobacterium pectinovorum TaxID=29533 RepID=A0A502EL86_9FLAO|nr:hypothetical protein [Flavobacterium pectinovorum]TPG38478.1 hypothetical protein EAH81_16295 [Flavobacterium pectinovorum]